MEQSDKNEKSKRDDGGHAFPGGVNQTYRHLERGDPTQCGMTLRQWYAGMALQGHLSQEIADTDDKGTVAAELFAWADAMIAEGAK